MFGEVSDEAAGQHRHQALVPGHKQGRLQLGRPAQQALVHKHCKISRNLDS